MKNPVFSQVPVLPSVQQERALLMLEFGDKFGYDQEMIFALAREMTEYNFWFFSTGEQDTLNPIGVNCIRSFTGRGVRVWGARTLSSDPAWRYINVRRLFNYVEKSLERGLQWVVFEPNDPDTVGARAARCRRVPDGRLAGGHALRRCRRRRLFSSSAMRS